MTATLMNPPLQTVPHASTDGSTVVATVEVPAPPERIFHALTTNEVERWWGSPDTYRVTDWDAVLCPGGHWKLVVRLPDGRAFPASGTFLKLTPDKIVQTRRYNWDHPTLGRDDTIVTYLLDPIDGGTRLTIRHEGFAGRQAAADEHVHGWERFLGWLEAYLTGVPNLSGSGRTSVPAGWNRRGPH